MEQALLFDKDGDGMIENEVLMIYSCKLSSSFMLFLCESIRAFQIKHMTYGQPLGYKYLLLKLLPSLHPRLYARFKRIVVDYGSRLALLLQVLNMDY